MSAFNTYQPTDIEPGRLNCWDCKYDCNCEEVNTECKANCIYNNEVYHYKDCFERKINSLNDLFGRTVECVSGCYKDSDRMEIKFTDGLKVVFEPSNSMANVSIDDVNGDPQGMVGHMIKKAEVATNIQFSPKNEWDSNYKWTFYRFATFDGYVDVKWYGTSTGYYSEKVIWEVVDENDNIIASGTEQDGYD